MTNRDQWERLKEILNQQIELLESINSLEVDLKSSLIQKDWVTLEDTFLSMDNLSSQLQQQEEQRHELFQSLLEKHKLHRDISFSRALSVLPEDQRSEMNTAYNVMRRNIILMQTKMENIRNYAASKAAVVKGLLEELVPEKRGQIYSRHGRPAMADQGALLLSTQM